MICPNCQTINESEYVFCVNCGASVSQAGNVFHDTKAPTQSFQNPLPSAPLSSAPPTEVFQNSPDTPPPTQFVAQPPPVYNTSNSIETSVVPVNSQFGASAAHNFAPSASFPVPQQQPRDNSKMMFLWAGLIFFGLVAVGIGAFFLVNREGIKSEKLPEHLGMFFQSKDKDKLDEIKKQDFTNAIEGKDQLMKDDGLVSGESNPNLILYSDSKEISLNDLRLVQLDTIKPDGSLKQIDFQAAPVEGKSEMKRIRIPDGLANGKYAFVIFDGYLDEGKHKFWAFQVKNSDKTNNDSSLKSTTVSLKPKEKKDTTTDNQTTTTQTRTPVVPPSTGSYAYSTTDHLILRQSPSLSGYDTGYRIRKGQRVYIQSLSSHTDTWKGRTGKWAYITTDDGYSGWVFTPLLRY